MRIPPTRYARSGEVHIAYQVFGSGAVDLVFVPGFISHVENDWTDPHYARWRWRLGSFARTVFFDKRGTGLSDRVHPMPGLDERMDDIRAVMDAVSSERAAIMGVSEGGVLASIFAATYPQRCRALVLYGAFAHISSWVANDAAWARFFDHIENAWGTGLPQLAPSMKDDRGFQEWVGRFERMGGDPGSVLSMMRVNRAIDITNVLASIHVPTLVIHRTDDAMVNVKGGRALAKLIPGARLVELPGVDHAPFVGDNSDTILDLIDEFLTGSKPAPAVDRVLATVVFTDIVDSTKRAEALGDRAWRDLLDRHDHTIRQELARFDGREVKSLGDGFLATFDGPARAIRCAVAIRDALKALDIHVRVGIHTGEVEFADGDVRGIAVHIASRVIKVAQPDDVLVSRTVRDLIAG